MSTFQAPSADIVRTAEMRGSLRRHVDATNRPPVESVGALVELAGTDPSDVIGRAIELAGHRADPDGARLEALVRAFASDHAHLIALSHALAPEGGYRVGAMLRTLRSQIRDAGLRAACMAPWMAHL